MHSLLILRLFRPPPTYKLCNLPVAISTRRRHVFWGAKTWTSISHVRRGSTRSSILSRTTKFFFRAYSLHTYPGRQMEITDRRRWSCLKAFVMWQWPIKYQIKAHHQHTMILQYCNSPQRQQEESSQNFKLASSSPPPQTSCHWNKMTVTGNLKERIKDAPCL